MDDHIEADIDRILEGFSRTLSDIDVTEELFVDRERSTRSPLVTAAPDGFRMRVLANAPKSDGERIFAERRSW
jgi:phage FluMu gp28-like protein